MENTRNYELNTMQGRLLRMLIDLEELCRANGIGFFLCGETALMAYRDGTLSDRVTVCIDAKSTNDFIAAVSKTSGYDKQFVLESMLNNGSYPNLEIRYCDLGTTDFDIKNCRSYINNCLHITIKFIEHIPRTRITFALSRYRFRQYRKNIRSAAIDSNPAGSSALFRSMIRTASANSDKVWLNGKQMKAGLFKKSTAVTIDGHEFAVPGKGTDYLALEFGNGWRKHECYSYKESSENFISCNIPWTEYDRAFQGIDFDSYVRAQKEDKKFQEKFKKENVKVVKCYDILERTFDRIYLFQQYSPKKAQLMELDRLGKTDELRSELEEYIDFINKHYARGLGICFDQDILEITLKLLRSDVGDKYADDVRALIPEQHLKPIRLKDYRGNYI